MKAKTQTRKQVKLSHYKLQELNPTQVRPLTWKYATKIVDPIPYTHLQRLGSGDGAGSWLQVGLAIVAGVLLLPVMLGLPLAIAYLVS